jgi:hypothetical protein
MCLEAKGTVLVESFTGGLGYFGIGIGQDNVG